MVTNVAMKDITNEPLRMQNVDRALRSLAIQ